MQTGSSSSDAHAKDKKTGQYTGWYLKGFKGTRSYTAPAARSGTLRPSATTSSASRTYGDWTSPRRLRLRRLHFGDYTFEDVSGTEWGEWDALPGENPDDCLRSQNADHITQISNVMTPGAITDGAITDGAIIVGDTEPGAVIGEYGSTAASPTATITRAP